MSIDLDTLIELLLQRYPNKIPKDPLTTLDTFRIMRGNQQVIEFIRELKLREEARIHEANKLKKR